jgi:hypothetical protein
MKRNQHKQTKEIESQTAKQPWRLEFITKLQREAGS